MIYHKLSSALLGLLRSRFFLLLFLLWHHHHLKVQSMSCFHWRRLCATTAWYVPFGRHKTIFSTKKRKPTGRQPKLMFRWILNLRKALVDWMPSPFSVLRNAVKITKVPFVAVARCTWLLPGRGRDQKQPVRKCSLFGSCYQYFLLGLRDDLV